MTKVWIGNTVLALAVAVFFAFAQEWALALVTFALTAVSSAAAHQSHRLDQWEG